MCSDACDLTLDPNTANTRLILSDENRKATLLKDHQSYPDHPDRFDEEPQVLCGESLTGRCYWEAVRNGDAEISVAYKGINRKEGETVCLDPMTNPGVCGAMMTDSLSGTVITELIYLLSVHLLIELECMWTCRLALCLSTASLTHTHSHTYTHSTPHSLNPSMLDLGC